MAAVLLVVAEKEVGIVVVVVVAAGLVGVDLVAVVVVAGPVCQVARDMAAVAAVEAVLVVRPREVSVQNYEEGIHPIDLETGAELVAADHDLDPDRLYVGTADNFVAVEDRNQVDIDLAEEDILDAVVVDVAGILFAEVDIPAVLVAGIPVVPGPDRIVLKESTEVSYLAAPWDRWIQRPIPAQILLVPKYLDVQSQTTLLVRTQHNKTNDSSSNISTYSYWWP